MVRLAYIYYENERGKERLQRSGADDVRKGSSPADGFVLAVLPWLLKVVLATSRKRPGRLLLLVAASATLCL